MSEINTALLSNTMLEYLVKGVMRNCVSCIVRDSSETGVPLKQIDLILQPLTDDPENSMVVRSEEAEASAMELYGAYELFPFLAAVLPAEGPRNDEYAFTRGFYLDVDPDALDQFIAALSDVEENWKELDDMLAEDELFKAEGFLPGHGSNTTN